MAFNPEWGHKLVVGDVAKIRKMEVRLQKHDRRDAEPWLNLLAVYDVVGLMVGEPEFMKRCHYE